MFLNGRQLYAELKVCQAEAEINKRLTLPLRKSLLWNSTAV